MPKIKWVKQLTRENTLLDRSLRALAYRDALRKPKVGQATISNCLLVGQGRVTSLYYLPADYKKQQQVIVKEFKGKNIAKMSQLIVELLEEGYIWAKIFSQNKISKKDLLSYYYHFLKYHAYARGAILYGYWGEPKITGKLRLALAKKVKAGELDHIISVLSSPQIVKGVLMNLYHPEEQVLAEKNKVLQDLKLSQKERELVEILSWFTFFYEVGERVASYLYEQLNRHLRYSFSQSVLNELEWYDPASFEMFLQKGKRLSKEEIRKREKFWIMKMIKGRWQLLVGDKAQQFFHRYLEEKVDIKQGLIKGTVASPGKAVGRVKIIVTVADQKKMKKGDVLLSPMTTPRLMGAIRKAAAIVTDEGGMTAHAAIVARELKIPCIVGTKVATRVFRDRDLVEVDAERGIVKKIDEKDN